MKIRHVLPGDNLWACYYMKVQPYGRVYPLAHKALIDRDGESEIIGFIVKGRIVPADEVDDNTRFMGYHDPALMSKENWQIYINQLVAWGRQWAAEDQPLPVTDTQLPMPEGV